LAACRNCFRFCEDQRFGPADRHGSKHRAGDRRVGYTTEPALVCHIGERIALESRRLLHSILSRMTRDDHSAARQRMHYRLSPSPHRPSPLPDRLSLLVAKRTTTCSRCFKKKQGLDLQRSSYWPNAESDVFTFRRMAHSWLIAPIRVERRPALPFHGCLFR
jgi:hypothetical protein